MTRKNTGLIISILTAVIFFAGAVIDLTAGVLPTARYSNLEKPQQPFVPTLDRRGPYVLWP